MLLAILWVSLSVSSAENNKQEAGQPLITSIQGVYKHRFKTGTINGEKYTAEDILEIVPVADDAVYFKTSLQFYNGHACFLYGVARLSENGRLVYTSHWDDFDGKETFCRLELEPSAQGIILHDDDEHPCREDSCGARGGYDGVVFAKKERRPIKYLALLKASDDYKNALKEAGIKAP